MIKSHFLLLIFFMTSLSYAGNNPQDASPSPLQSASDHSTPPNIKLGHQKAKQSQSKTDSIKSTRKLVFNSQGSSTSEESSPLNIIRSDAPAHLAHPNIKKEYQEARRTRIIGEAPTSSKQLFGAPSKKEFMSSLSANRPSSRSTRHNYTNNPYDSAPSSDFIKYIKGKNKEE